jgi:rare lipoprotein A
MRRTVWSCVYQVSLAALALSASAVGLTTGVQAKLAGQVHCYNDICHRVRTADETAGRRGIIEPVLASFYDSPENDRFNPRNETSSGAQFDARSADNAASPIHPDGTVLLVWSPVTGGAAIVRVNNAGPYYPGRTLDVSRGVAEKIGFARGGVMQLLTVVVAAPSEPETHYQRGRVYPAVPGYLGHYETLAEAAMDDPDAHSAVFQEALVESTSQQMLLTAAATQIKAAALATALRDAPTDDVTPPELGIGIIEAAVNESVAKSTGFSTASPSSQPLVRVATLSPPRDLETNGARDSLLTIAQAPLQSRPERSSEHLQRHTDAETLVQKPRPKRDSARLAEEADDTSPRKRVRQVAIADELIPGYTVR